MYTSYYRNVTDADILSLERRLLQTMDMIISKKKRSDKDIRVSNKKLFAIEQ